MSERPTQLFVASTAYGLATLVAALDDGLYPDARRILVTSNNTTIPESSPEIVDVTGTATLLERFDAVHSYNAAIRPQHPTVWQSRGVDLPLWERYFRLHWELGTGPVTLVLESLQAPPAHTLAQVFSESAIDVYADGLMCFGPTRVGLPLGVAARIERLLFVDLLPGVVPLLLQDFDVPSVRISNQSLVRVIEAMGAPATERSGRPPAILLGQYLAAAGLLTEAEELDLHQQMIIGAVAAGHRDLIFKPHPSAPPLAAQALVATAAAAGADLRVVDDPALVETWFAHDRVGLVVGCFSTALLTARALYGLPVARVGTDLLLRRLRPYANSNRIPAMVVDATVPDLSTLGRDEVPVVTSADLSTLVQTVGYCMQPQRYAGLRALAVRALDPPGAPARRYVSRGRRTKLGLPGASAPRHPLKAALLRVIGPDRYHRLRSLTVSRARSTSPLSPRKGETR